VQTVERWVMQTVDLMVSKMVWILAVLMASLWVETKADYLVASLEQMMVEMMDMS
jgi:hypothetical protein